MHFLLLQVHHGFYSAYHNTTVRPGVLKAIERARQVYGDLKIMVTGHSMGGAMASFCGLDLTVTKSKFSLAFATYFLNSFLYLRIIPFCSLA